MGNMNWSKLVLLASLASFSLSLASPVAEAEAVSRYGRGYTGHSGYRYRAPGGYRGQYRRGYQGQYNGDAYGYKSDAYGYNSDAYGYNGVNRKYHAYHQPTIQTHRQSGYNVIQQKEVDRFIPVEQKQTQQKFFLEQDTVPTIRINELTGEVISPSFSVEIDLSDPQNVASDFLSEQFVQQPITNSVDQLIPLQVQSEPEDKVFNFPSEPSMNTFIVPNIPNPQNQIPASPTPTFKFPPRIPAEPSVLSLVQQPSPTVENSSPNLSSVPPPPRPDPVPQSSSPQIQPPNLPAPTFKFPPRIPAEPSVPSSVQQTSLTVQNLRPTVQSPPTRIDNLQAVPAVPGRPVLTDNTVQTIKVQSSTVQSVPAVRSSFIPMPVPAVPSLSK